MQNMQHEKTFDQLIKDNLKSIKISPCERFHELLGNPLYENRFIKAGKFHEPGLAPVYDQTGAYHINVRYRLASQQKNYSSCIIKSKNTSDCVTVHRLQLVNMLNGLGAFFDFKLQSTS